VADALSEQGDIVDVRIFGKPTTRPYRRMAVALASAADADEARAIAKRAADAVRIAYRD
jgi:phosphoribosylglycinamide formyltransferase 2